MTLKSLRQQAGLTQVQLADKLGVTADAVCTWETGKSRPHDDRLPAIADVLNVDTATLTAALPDARPPGPRPTLDTPLVRLREQAGLTRRQVAEQIDVLPVTLRNWEAGHKRPSWPRLAELADIYDVDVVAVNDALTDPHDDAPLTRARKLVQLTATEAADKLGVSTSVLASVEQGQRRPPITLREDLCSLYAISDDELEQHLPQVDPPWGLRQLREIAGLTQADIARRLGSHRQLVSNWECGHHRPRPDTLRSLAEIYQVDLATVTAAVDGNAEPAPVIESAGDDPTWWMPIESN